VTSTGLLEAYLWGDERAGKLWQEYASVFKGKKFLDTSPGLRARLNELKEEYREELDQLLGEEEEPPEFRQVAYLGPEAWKQVVHFRIQLWLLAETKLSKGDSVHVKQFLEDFGITQVYYPDLDHVPPDWLYPDKPPPELIPEIEALNKFVKDWNNGEI
jgi:hypothetical protein